MRLRAKPAQLRREIDDRDPLLRRVSSNWRTGELAGLLSMWPHQTAPLRRPEIGCGLRYRGNDQTNTPLPQPVVQVLYRDQGFWAHPDQSCCGADL